MKLVMLKIFYFASLREQLGMSDERVEHVAGESLQMLASRLAQAHGDAGSALLDASTACALNQQMVDSLQTLADGDEVAFFPPVTGG